MDLPSTSLPFRAAALVGLLVMLAACATPADGETSAAPTVALGGVGGEVTSTGPVTGPAPSESVAATTPAPTNSPTPAPTPAPTQPPAQADGFTAVVRACASISGSSCNGEYGTMPAGTGTFTALVTFTDANGGDQISVTLIGPNGTIPGAPYTLRGGGDGYYYSVFQASALPAGTYTLVASRNGEEVATTQFTIGG